MQGVDGNGIGFGDVGLVEVFDPLLFDIGDGGFVVDEEAFFPNLPGIQAAHEVHHGAHVGELAVVGPFLLFFFIGGGYVAEQWIAIVGNDMVGEVADESFQSVFELIAEGFVLDEQGFDGGDAELVAFEIEMEAQCVLVLYGAFVGISCGAYEILPEGPAISLPAVLEVGFDGYACELFGLGGERYV